jgi:type I restriction enzyme S subunit
MNAHDLRVAEATASYRVAPLLTHHLDTFASAPEGFKRLRELVLNLAVRGKLVPQDPKDEPASEVLKWRARELAGVDAEGKVKRSKPQAFVDDDDRPFEVPSTWAWVRLGEVVEVLDSLRKPVTKGDRKPGPYPYYGASGIVDYVSDFLFDEDLVLVGEDGAKWGAGDQTAFAISGKTWVNNHAHVLRPNRTLLSDKYLIRALVALDLQPFITGTTVPKLNQAKLVSIGIPIPPLAEQSRIVAKVDELMALIDAIEAKVDAGETARDKLLDTLLAALADSPDAAATAEAWAQLAPHFDLLLQTPADVDRLQQTLLQLAVKGRLVPQNPNDEPAAELLKRIRAEKTRLTAGGEIKRARPLPVRDDAELPFSVPLGWQWASLGDVVLSSEAGWSPSCENMPRESGKWGVLKVSAVSWGEFLDEENKALPSHLEARPEYAVQPGDFLLSRANTAELVARSVVAWNPKPRLMLSDKIIRLHTASGVDKAYLNLFNNSSFARTHYVANASGTSASMKNVSREVVLALPVPVPPAAEQSRIVAAVASLTALCDRLRERLAARLALSAKLTAALTEGALS